MKPSRKLIDALRSAAARIEKGDQGGYNWSSACSCNCGVLFQELTGTKHNDDPQSEFVKWMVGIFAGMFSVWTDAIESRDGVHCNVTGVPYKNVIKMLESYGLDQSDIETIEFCGTGRKGHPDSEDDSGAFADFDQAYGNPAIVSEFMRKKADELEAQLAEQPATAEEETHQQVTVGK